MRRCGICERLVSHDHDPFYVETDPGHYDDECFEVALASHLFVHACWSCFTRWPTPRKRRCGELTLPEREQFAELLLETAP